METELRMKEIQIASVVVFSFFTKECVFSSMPECSYCSHTIDVHFCPNCGQKHVKQRLSIKSLFSDLIYAFFSFDSGILLSIRMLAVKPKFVFYNYIGGYRKKFLSPSSILFIATTFFGLSFLFEEKDFFILSMGDGDAPSQIFTFLVLLTFMFLSSLILYKKRSQLNIIELLTLNLYAFGFNLIWLSMLSIIFKIFSFKGLDNLSIVLGLVLIFYFNARVLKQGPWKQIGFTLLQLVIFLVMISFTLFVVSGGDFQIELEG